MSKVIFLHPTPPDYLTCDYTACPELERRILSARYSLAEEHIASILEDRRLRVRAAKWARRKAAVVNWLRFVGLVLILACAFTVITGAFYLAGQVGYFSTQGEWLP